MSDEEDFYHFCRFCCNTIDEEAHRIYRNRLYTGSFAKIPHTALSDSAEVDLMLISDSCVAVPAGLLYSAKKARYSKQPVILWICLTGYVHPGFTRLMRTDIGEYLDREEFNKLLGEVASTIVPGQDFQVP